jgi:phosphate starvation-inducible PhoH-like protein
MTQTFDSKAVHIQPKTEKQDDLLTAIKLYDLVVTTGPAGVGKTYISVNAALNALFKGQQQSIILTRPNISTGRSLGFFPGDIKEKLEPWLAPMLSEMKKRLGETHLDNLKRKGKIQIQPFETVRGSSFDNSFILVDEAQNLTYEEIKAITTRIGVNSKMVLMGDPMQKDQKYDDLAKLQKILKKYEVPSAVVTFTVNDIVRSDIVANLVKAYMQEEGLLLI